MTASTLSGKEAAAQLRGQVTAAVAGLAGRGVAATLAIVIATADESAAWYVRSLAAAAARLCVGCQITDLGPGASEDAITSALAGLSADPGMHGILVQTPLPAGISPQRVAQAIDPARDVDGASPLSLGRLTAGLPAFAPATAAAVVELLDFHGVELAGRRVVIVGRSVVVGKPLAQLLLSRDATVTVCHSRTRDLASVTGEAEILVAAAGRPGLITASHVRPGAVVIDVGTNPTADGGLTGDVDAGVAGVAGALSPVPGGVGPVTTARLLLNTAQAAGRAQA